MRRHAHVSAAVVAVFASLSQQASTTLRITLTRVRGGGPVPQAMQWATFGVRR